MTPYETMTRHFQNHSALSETDDAYPSKKTRRAKLDIYVFIV